MAIYQPTNVIPSVLSGYGKGVVDAADGLTVSWQVNGESALVAYRIVIQQNTSASTQVYTTGKVTLSEPFYGKDYEGEIQMFEANTISASTLSTAGITNGYANGYKLVITQWWSSTAYVIQTSASVFYTKAAPVFEITNPGTLTQRLYTFSASYSQAQGDAVDYIHWQLTDADGNIVKDTGKIYGTADLRFSFGGFLDGQTYTLAADIETSSGVTAYSSVTFGVAYSSYTVAGMLTACPRKGENGVLLTWGALHYIPCTAGAYTLADGKLTLVDTDTRLGTARWSTDNGSAMYYQPPWTVVWSGTLIEPEGDSGAYTFLAFYLPDFNTVLFKATIRAIYDEAESRSYLYMEVAAEENGFTRTMLTEQIGRWNTGALAQIKAIVFTRTMCYVVYESYTEELYYNGYASIPASPIGVITLNASSITDYLWVANGVIPSAMLAGIEAGTFTPSWAEQQNMTYFLATFDANLGGGNYNESFPNASGMTVYRRDANGTYLTKIGSAPLADGALRDYSAKSQKSYVYQGFLYNGTEFSKGSFQSGETTPLWWNYAVLECIADEDGVYHVINEYTFENNVSTSAITNNNSPEMLKNFTRYPIKQYDTANYRSGTLTALIGKVDMAGNTYTDTTELAEQIWALSISTNPKFLKDRKGNLFMIETDAAVTMQTDDMKREQPYTMALPWAEVGDAADAVIMTNSEDEGWPTDGVIETTLYINPATGSLMWNKGADYYGSELSISSAGSLLQTKSGGYTPATLKLSNGNLLATT